MTYDKMFFLILVILVSLLWLAHLLEDVVVY
jgi:hypothetical protein